MNNEHTETEYTENDVQEALNVLESLDFSEKMGLIALLEMASIFG